MALSAEYGEVCPGRQRADRQQLQRAKTRAFEPSRAGGEVADVADAPASGRVQREQRDDEAGGAARQGSGTHQRVRVRQPRLSVSSTRSTADRKASGRGSRLTTR